MIYNSETLFSFFESVTVEMYLWIEDSCTSGKQHEKKKNPRNI